MKFMNNCKDLQWRKGKHVNGASITMVTHERVGMEGFKYFALSELSEWSEPWRNCNRGVVTLTACHRSR